MNGFCFFCADAVPAQRERFRKRYGSLTDKWTDAEVLEHYLIMSRKGEIQAQEEEENPVPEAAASQQTVIEVAPPNPQQCIITRRGNVIQLDARNVWCATYDECSSVVVPEVLASALRRLFPLFNVIMDHESVTLQSRTTVDQDKNIVAEKIITRVGVQASEETPVQPEQVVNLEFVESGPGEVETIPDVPTSDSLAMHDLVPNMDLAQFLGRPVLISSFDWTTSTAYGAQSTFNPWYLFMNHSQIQYKLNNYAFIRGKLKLKWEINASPFFYGRMFYSYRPLTGLNGETIDAPDSTGMDLLAYTQRPHVFLDPSKSQGAEMELPFFYYKNWLQLGNSTEINNMGTITPYVFNTLQGANGQTGTATIRIFASMVDVQVSAPTYNLSAQALEIDLTEEEDEERPRKLSKFEQNKDFARDMSRASHLHALDRMAVTFKYALAKRDPIREAHEFARKKSRFYVQADEFQSNPVSAPATAIAEAAGLLAKIPSIRPFALATQFGASTVAKVGRALGYSVTSSVREIVSWKPVCAPPLAVVDHSYPYDRLSTDPKQGLSIDPGLHGLPSIDELSISHLVQKEAFITTVNWAMSSADDTTLLNLAAVPWYFNTGTSTGTSQYACTPAAWIAYLFDYWRGDVIFRFQVVCTQYHKGRLRLTYDPQADITGTNDTITSSITEIVDIGTTTDFEVRIPYMQAYAMLKTLPFNSAVVPFQTSGFSNLHSEGYSNGQMTLKVFNRLLGPTSSGTVPINVFMRCADNMEFAAPGSSNNQFTNVPTRFGVQAYQSSDQLVSLVMGSPSPSPHPERFKLVMGEVITTLRQMISRLTLSYYDMSPDTTTAANTNVELRLSRGRFPPLYGYETGTQMHSAASLTGGGTQKFNFAGFHCIPYILPAFVGVRGSMNWHVMLSNAKAIGYATALRTPGYGLNMLNTGINAGGPFTDASQASRSVLTGLFNQFTGAMATSQLNQAALSFNVPNYSQFRFDSTDPSTYNSGTGISSTTDGRFSNFSINLELNPAGEGTTVATTKVLLHAGAGHDFLPLFFLNVPFMYVYNSVPAAV